MTHYPFKVGSTYYFTALGGKSHDNLAQDATYALSCRCLDFLCALCALANLGNWDVKLLAAGTADYVEFWEDQVFFYSDNSDALEKAEEIFEFYELRTPISFAPEMIT